MKQPYQVPRRNGVWWRIHDEYFAIIFAKDMDKSNVFIEEEMC